MVEAGPSASACQSTLGQIGQGLISSLAQKCQAVHMLGELGAVVGGAGLVLTAPLPGAASKQPPVGSPLFRVASSGSYEFTTSRRLAALELHPFGALGIIYTGGRVWNTPPKALTPAPLMLGDWPMSGKYASLANMYRG